MPAALQHAVEHETRAETRADREEHEIVDAACDALPALAERREVDVVLDRHRQADSSRELAAKPFAFEPGDVPGERDAPARALDRSRHAKHHAVDEARGRAGRFEERARERFDRVERRGGGAFRQLHVLACPDLAAHVAERAAHEARAEVEPEHERRLGHGLEERRAIARPIPSPLPRLPHETGCE